MRETEVVPRSLRFVLRMDEAFLFKGNRDMGIGLCVLQAAFPIPESRVTNTD